MQSDDEDVFIFHRVYRCLQRRNLLVGCEPEALVPLAAIAIYLTFMGGSFLTAGVGITLLLVGLPVLRALAKSDPWAMAILHRHFQYGNYYPAWASLHAPIPVGREQQPQ